MATRPHRRVQSSLPPVHSPGKGPCSDSCRAPASPPHLFVNGVLRVHGLVKGGIFAPGACDIAEVAQSAALAANASAPGQGFNRHFVQTFVLLTGSSAKSFVQTIRHVADAVLHAYIVGIAGNKCKHCSLRDGKVVAPVSALPQYRGTSTSMPNARISTRDG